MSEKYIVRVIRKTDGVAQVDQVFEQEFENLDVSDLARHLNTKPERKDGQDKDNKSVKL